MIVSALLASLLAAGPRVQLVYSPEAPGCPDRPTLEAAVSARLGYQPFDDSATRRAEVHLVPDGSGLKGSLQIFEGEKSVGRRSFSSPTSDCSELASSVELALAIAIDPQHALAPPPEPAAPPAPPKEQPAEPSPPPPPAEPPLPSYLGLALSGALMTGLTPTLTGTFGLEVSIRSFAFEGTLWGRADIPSSAPNLSTNSFTGGLAACGVLRYVGFCGVVGGGALQLAKVARITQPLFLTGARITGRFEVLPHVLLLPFVEVLAIPTRVTVVLGNDVIWVTPPVTVSTGLLVRYEFELGSEIPPPRPKSP